MGKDSRPQCVRGVQLAASTLAERVAAMREQMGPLHAGDVVGVHQMRVGSRRMRAALQLLDPWLDEAGRLELEKAARTITRGLGRARELDVMIGMLAEHAERTEGLWRRTADYAMDQLRAERASLDARCREAADIAETNITDEAVQRAIAGTRPRACARKVVRNELTMAHDKVCKRYKRWKKSGENEALHRVRIAFKKLRYACEIGEPLYGASMTKLLKRLKQAQEHLGQWNDQRVLCENLYELALAAPPREAQGFPLLLEDLTAEADELKAAFAKDAKKFFKSDAQKRDQKFLSKTKVKCC